MSREDAVVHFMKTQGVTEEERKSLSDEERHAMQRIALKAGCAIVRDAITGRWFFVQAVHERELRAIERWYKTGPRQRPHPRTRPRRRRFR